jgi:predicted nucleotidyltransferase
MADGIVTLQERHRCKMERMEHALVEIDAALTAYAREHGGRFIRFGSTIEGRMRGHSDVDIIADFPGETSIAAADVAEDICFAYGMTPDAHAGAYVSSDLRAEAERRGLVLA